MRGLWARVVDRDNSQRVGREELRGYLDGDADRRRDDRQSYETRAGTTAPDQKMDTTGWAKAQAIHGLYLTCCDGSDYANTSC